MVAAQGQGMRFGPADRFCMLKPGCQQRVRSYQVVEEAGKVLLPVDELVLHYAKSGIYLAPGGGKDPEIPGKQHLQKDKLDEIFRMKAGHPLVVGADSDTEMLPAGRS